MRTTLRGGDKRLLKARLIVDGESFGGVIRETCRPAERRVRGIAVNKVSLASLRERAVKRAVNQRHTARPECGRHLLQMHFVDDARVRVASRRDIEFAGLVQPKKPVETRAIQVDQYCRQLGRVRTG